MAKKQETVQEVEPQDWNLNESVEALAKGIYVRLITASGADGSTPEHIARLSIERAKAFFQELRKE